MQKQRKPVDRLLTRLLQIFCNFIDEFISGYGKTVSHVIIGLKTAKGTKQLKLDPSIYESLQKEKVDVGDVIYIEANSGAVKRQGRSDTFATEFDLEVRFLISSIELKRRVFYCSYVVVYRLKSTFHFPKETFTKEKK